MKKFNDLIKSSIIGVVIGETIASYYKDDKFKEDLKTAKGFDKCKVILNNLIDVNKKFFAEVKGIDFEAGYDNAKNFFDDKIAKINLKADEILTNINNINNEKIKLLVKDLGNKIEKLKNQIKSQIDNISEKVKLEDKIKMIDSKLNQIKTRLGK